MLLSGVERGPSDRRSKALFESLASVASTPSVWAARSGAYRPHSWSVIARQCIRPHSCHFGLIWRCFWPSLLFVAACSQVGRIGRCSVILHTATATALSWDQLVP